MSNSALSIYQQYESLQKASSALYKSGYFKDVTSEAQAIVKVLAGAELGIAPFASMTGINIIQGKPVLGANLLATLVKNDPRYDYHIQKIDAESCVIEWIENGKPVGTSSFTIQEAQKAGLTNKDNWIKYTSDMLFARAISRGVRRFAPGVFGGSPVYTPDEIGADTDEDGNVINVKVTELSEPEILGKLGYANNQPPKESTDTATQMRPLAPEVLALRLADHANRIDAAIREGNTQSPTDTDRKVLASVLDTTLNGDEAARHATLHYLTGFASTKDLTPGTVVALMKWLEVKAFGDVPPEVSITEARAAYAAALMEQGQLELSLPEGEGQLP